MRASVPFVGPSYEARSIAIAAQRTVNCYLEYGLSASLEPMPIALIGTPGLRKILTLPDAPIRGAIQCNGFAWFVAGSHVYRVSSAWVVTDCGTINTSAGLVSLANNATEVLIVDGVNGYLVDTTTATVAQIADPDFPNGVTSSTYQDGFFIVAGDNSGRFYINETPNVGTAWNGLDFASAEGSPDLLVSILSDHRELWLVGTNSAEVWVNTGNADFPFERSGNVFIEHGCAAPFTLCKLDNTVFWLGADDRGYGVVYRADGYNPQRISTHAIERAIQSYGDISDAFAFTYQQEGHAFMVLTFPSASKTWVFDAATGQWHERAYFNEPTGEFSRWRANTHCFFNNLHLVGDYEDGRVYALDLDYFTDDENTIKRVRATQNLKADQVTVFYSMLQVEAEPGVGLISGQGLTPKMLLRYSNDYGRTWSGYLEGSLGPIGEYLTRTIFWQLGSGRNRVWELSMTDPVKFIVTGAVLEFERGYA